MVELARGVEEAGGDVLGLEVGVVGQDLLLRLPGGEELEVSGSWVRRGLVRS